MKNHLSLKNQKKQLLIFHKILWVSYKMETQKIINLLNDSSNEESKFAFINFHNYKQGDTIKLERESIKTSLCDHSDI